MPVEIKELIVKTQIVSQEKTESTNFSQEALQQFKLEILSECRKMIKQEMQSKHKR